MTDASDPLLQRQLQRLDELAELGLDVARAVAARAHDQGADVEAVARAYARVSRAVRLTIMLQSRLAQDLKAAERAAERAAADLLARSDPRYIHKARVERIVERIAQETHRGDEEEIDRLVIEAGERLDDEDLYGEVLDRPIRELVADICRALDLDPDWKRLDAEAWALTSPIAAAMAGGGPCAERSEERMGAGENPRRYAFSSPAQDSS
jgi:hypothetical protein